MDPGTAMLVGGTAVNVISGLWGGSKRASAAREQAEAQNRAMMAKYQYDLDAWQMKKEQLQASRNEAVDRIITSAVNEGKQRAYKDVQALENYDYSLKIRDLKQTNNEIAFKRSDDIYSDQMSLNSISSRAAMDSEIVKLEEKNVEDRFNRNDSYIEMIQNEGKLRAMGASGRSANKAVQASMADYGRQMSMLNASMDSSFRDTRGALEEIIRDKTSADLTAFASKMLDPGVLPDPIKPKALPVPEFDLPRIYNEFDFGPQPVMGAMASPGAAASAAWGSTISGIGSTIGGAMTTWGSQNTKLFTGGGGGSGGSGFSQGDYIGMGGSATDAATIADGGFVEWSTD
tara:strand:- start:2099 stop:3133 length:1035 start_codon:yes stop_codon:yes gene_type:complete